MTRVRDSDDGGVVFVMDSGVECPLKRDQAVRLIDELLAAGSIGLATKLADLISEEAA